MMLVLFGSTEFSSGSLSFVVNGLLLSPLAAMPALVCMWLRGSIRYTHIVCLHVRANRVGFRCLCSVTCLTGHVHTTNA